ncbi:endonuclease/exonuclease/phosphatase family protein [Altererythrobacter sp. KTW20L]|uniref:endonuclease/exonuclease/phosphatase family protein n=1 Tax=Altererythrobacter sp. KTW20L TaxID=2942210 RepID=UPI0020BF4DD3|nr:endonuclease/exonuclease/phosphatase family protein [Altererythrobacter sp. KTW20L]MCL6251064.1 endonuclease/exonuclease/phosphatase family protein [Altererythrobacter sp. KTW20L]
MLSLLLAGCVNLPEARSASCALVDGPPIATTSDGDWATTEIDVLTYNIEGLGWPARKGRGHYLEEIGNEMALMRIRGDAPHIVLFQEVFSNSAVRAIEAGLYPSSVNGPRRTQRRPQNGYGSLEGKKRPDRGEIGLRIVSGGLMTVSEFPIVSSHAEPFPRGSCAGFDCLANKGMLLAEIAVPGVPGTVLVFNTHLNAQRSSRVAPRRYHAAHARQTEALVQFIEKTRSHLPVIFGGDLNMRHSEERFEVFAEGQTLDLVHQHCIDNDDSCTVEMSWDGDAPWIDTQDLQLFASGASVEVRPVRVAAMFDGAKEPKLSDHDGLRVTYELRWRTDGVGPEPHCPA